MHVNALLMSTHLVSFVKLFSMIVRQNVHKLGAVKSKSSVCSVNLDIDSVADVIDSVISLTCYH